MSDVYAMGGRPLFALNIVGFPAQGLDRRLLAEILRGGTEKVAEAGAAIVGGHTIDDREPKYGLAVIGEVHPDRIRRKGGGRPGDALVLTKAIGTGIISTAIKTGVAPEDAVAAAIASMTTLNRAAAELLDEADVGAVTDVTGYGLVNHLAEICRASGVGARLAAGSVPLLPHARALAEAGHVPGGTRKNLRYAERHARWDDRVDEVTRVLLCDAQTSGGLLFSVAPREGDRVVAQLRDLGLPAARVGTLVPEPASAMVVEP
jgi:selenide,water dikinase